MNCNMKMLIVAVAAVGLTSAAFTSFGHHRMASGKSYTHGHGGGYQRGHFRGRAAHGFRRGPGARRGRGMRVERLFTNFDSDKDGKLTQAEVNKARADRLAKFDTDKDGKLSLKEYEPLWAETTRRRLVARFQRLDADDDGRVTGEEFSARLSSVVARMDRDDDGALMRKDFRR